MLVFIPIGTEMSYCFKDNVKDKLEGGEVVQELTTCDGLQRTQDLFPAPVWKLTTTVCNYIPSRSITLFWLSRPGIHTHMYKHKIIENR